MKSYILIILFLVLFSGCGSASDTPPPVATFKNAATLPFMADGVSYVGMAAIPRKLKTSLRFQLSKSAERIVISTCHRAVDTLNPPNPFVFDYYAVHLIEDTESICILKAQVASKTEPMLLAVIDFYGEEVSMPAWVTCNGTSLRTGGASVCQAPVGLIQRITFDESVIVEPTEGCGKIECTGGNCTFRIGTGYCTYVFRGLKSGLYHRTTTRGLTPMED